jgi:hypothetical protein
MTALTIRLAGRTMMTIKALPVGVPGIMAHPTASGRPGWMLTHVRSGNGIAYFPPDVDPEVLLACAKELAPLTDWTCRGSDLANAQMARKIVAVTSRWGSVNRRIPAAILDDISPGGAA